MTGGFQKRDSMSKSILSAVVIAVIAAFFFAMCVKEKSHAVKVKQIEKLLKEHFVSVQGGTFTMGCTEEQGKDCEEDEKPAHNVTVGDFQIGKYEVTQKFWELVTGGNPSKFKGDDLPVENVSWDEVQIFISTLNAVTGKNCRLPTEAEWEYAARGGNRSQGYRYSGSNNLDEVAWYSGNSERKTHPVGQKQPNELGIYDMSGNVWEWCGDRYGTYPAGSAMNPAEPNSGDRRVYRGGDWGTSAHGCPVANRNSSYPSHRYSRLGFRIVISPNGGA